MVARALGKLHPGVDISFNWIESEGDRHTGVMLAQHGGKGLFTGALERALLDGQADLAVHSLKDLPAEHTPGLALAAIPRRGDVRDCLITRDGGRTLDAIPRGGLFGTSSPRRAAQVLRHRPDLRVALLRGNVDTRLRRVLDHEAPASTAHYDATLLAAAGLRRLGLREHLDAAIDVDTMLPAACQGALAVQCRADDHVTLTRCLPLNDATTATSVHAERGVVAAMAADCHSPIAVLAEPADVDPAQAKRNADAHWYRLRVRVLAADGSTQLGFDEQCKTRELRRLVRKAAEDLTARGARDLLAEAREHTLELPRVAPPTIAPARAG